MRMLHRIFILSIFSILCICLIYFTLKNKNLETFEEKRIIVRSGDTQQDSLNMFRLVNGLYLTYVDIEVVDFKWLNYNPIKNPPGPEIISTDDDIQKVYISKSVGVDVAVSLNNKGEVKITNANNSVTETDLREIIQIAPNSDDHFIALTTFNTVKRYNYDATHTEGEEYEGDSNDPIISIQGFWKSSVFLYLTMRGGLYTMDMSNPETPAIYTNISDVIQFNIPTYSNFSNYSSPPFSCIRKDSADNITIIFQKPGDAVQYEEHSINAITSLILENNDDYECYFVSLGIGGSAELYKFQTDVGNDATYRTNDKLDENIRNIISWNDTLYYIKSGGIYCNSDLKYFANTTDPAGTECITCGNNASPSQDGTDTCMCDDTASPEVRHHTHNDISENRNTFDASVNEGGCFDYKDCVPVGRCQPGQWLKTDGVPAQPLTEDIPIDEERNTACPACVPCSATASDAVALGDGVIIYGAGHPKGGTPLESGALCVDGSDECQYYVSNRCTPETDTVFAKKTIVTDFGIPMTAYSGDGDVDVDKPKDYGKYISQDAEKQYDAGDVRVEGTDDIWETCIPRDCCISPSAITLDKVQRIHHQSLPSVSPSGQEYYDCTNGNKRICDNCASEYRCSLDTPTSFFNIPFANDYCGSDITECSINTLLSSCGNNDSGKIKISDFLHDPSDECSRGECGHDGGGGAAGGGTACSGLFPQDCLAAELSSCSVFTS